MRRSLRFIAGFVALLIAVLLVGLYLRDHALGEQLVADVARLSTTRPRPVHREPAIGTTYQACLGPLLDVAPDAGTFATGVTQAIMDVVDGGMPYSALDANVQADFRVLDAWAKRNAECTRAPAVGDEPGMGPFAGWDTPRQNTRLYPSIVGKVLALEMRSDIEHGDAASALRTCADALAIGRDTVFDRGLIGAMHSVSITKLTLQSCAMAIASAPPASRRQFIVEVGTIRQGSASFASVLEIERAEMQLLAFGRDLSGSQRQRLTLNAQALAVNTSYPVALDMRRVAGWLYWPTFVTRIDRLIAAAPAQDRDKRFDEIEAETNLVAEIFEAGLPAGSMRKFAQRYDATPRGLDLLESAAQLALGEKPLPGVNVEVTNGRTVLSVPGFRGEALTIEGQAPGGR